MDGRNFTYMFYGFLAAWVILAAYVVALVGRQRRLERELENFKHLLEDREGERK